MEWEGETANRFVILTKKKLKMSVQDKANVKANKKEVIDPVSRIAN